MTTRGLSEGPEWATMQVLLGTIHHVNHRHTGGFYERSGWD